MNPTQGVKRRVFIYDSFYMRVNDSFINPFFLKYDIDYN